MKYFFLLFSLSLFSVPVFCQTLFTYGAEKVTKDEFLRAYNKNKTPVEDKEKSLREYLELYSKFKLKVKAAKQLRLDTLQQLKYDLQNFSSQVEEGYMNDEKISNALLDEVIERSQKDIHLIHFYIPLATGAAANDSAKASQAMEELIAELQKGSTEYNIIASAISQKYVAVSAKDIGYITALSLPYGMENLVYGLQPGAISKPYRTKSGLHVFKNAGERKSAGKWKIAQILFTLPPDASAAVIKETEKKADSVYALLKAGADFGEMAKKFSEDRLTALNGGEMAEFGTSKFDMPFETKVFALEKDDDISKPFSTTYGFHIVKRLQQHAIPADKTDETFVASLKQQMAKDARMNIAREKFLKDITALTNYKRNLLVKDPELFRYADSVVANRTVKNYPISNKIIISFTKENIKGAAWQNFVKDYKLNADVYKQESNKELLNKFIATTIAEYYRKHLAEYNSAFKYQMQEFKEGNMLFEIMERKVWSRASEDSIELKKYYDAHKASYKWDSSAAILLFNCSDSLIAQKAVAEVKNRKDWKKIAEESDGKIQSDSGRYELGQLQLQNAGSIVPGFISSPVTNSGDNTASFLKVLQLFPANQQRSFNDARGLVINEYQLYLEDKWVAELKKLYPVKVDEAVFQSLLKN
jgi:peptidyl-prolyl cis-trans isomerase SurA